MNTDSRTISPTVAYVILIIAALVAAGVLFFAVQKNGMATVASYLPFANTTANSGVDASGNPVTTTTTHTTTKTTGTTNTGAAATGSLSITPIATEVKLVSSTRSDTPASAVLSWKTSQNAKAVIAWGTAPNALTNSQAVTGGTMTQAYELKGLPRRTMIYYQITAISDAGNATVKSPAGSFMVN